MPAFPKRKKTCYSGPAKTNTTSPMRKLLINIFWTLNLLAAFALLAAYLAPFFNPNKINLFAFFGIGFPLFLYANMFFVPFWIIFKRKYIWLSLALLLLGYPMVKRHLQLFPERTTQSRDGIKIISYNVRNFAQLGRKSLKTTIHSIDSLLSGQHPDIICLQEAKHSKYTKGFLKHGFKKYGKSENIIYTNLPVIHQGNVIDKQDNKFGIYADVLFNNDTIRVYNIQLLSYSVSRDIEAYDKTKKVNRKQFFFSVASKLNSGFTRRVSETETLKKVLMKSPYPTIVCGDFNDPPASFTYQEVISTGLQDAFIESGNGYGNTYNWSFPKVRIDYIFTSSDFDIYNYKVLHTSLSDHMPIEAFLVPGE